MGSKVASGEFVGDNEIAEEAVGTSDRKGFVVGSKDLDGERVVGPEEVLGETVGLID